MSQTQALEVKVGMMVGIGLALFMISTILLGGGKSVLRDTYKLHVTFESTPGINPGSVVQLLGLPVGNVVKVSFSDESNGLVVEMQVEAAYQNKITKGSTAGMRTQGALGDKFIYITPNKDNTEPAADGEMLTPEIASDVFSALAEGGDSVKSIMKETHLLLSGLNAGGKSAQLIPSLIKTTDELQKLTVALRTSVAGEEGSNLKTTLASLDSVLKKIDKGQGTLGALINDPEIHERLKNVLGGSSRTNYMKSQVRETIKVEK